MVIYSGPRPTSCWARCDERNKRVPIWASEPTITSPAGAHGFVKLNPFPCESHRSGIQLDEPFASVVCAAHPSLCRCLHETEVMGAEGTTAPQVEQAKQSTQLHPSGTTRQWGSNAQVRRDDEGRSRGEAEKRVSGDPEKTPFPPVDSSTEQKPKGFPVPDGVDGVEGI